MKTKSRAGKARTKNGPSKRVGSGRLVGAGKSPNTIRRELRALRRFIDTTDDALAGRIAYAMETVLRWATQRTVGWELPVAEARSQAQCCRDMNEHTSALSPNDRDQPRGANH